MKYAIFERLTLAVGLIAIGATLAAGAFGHSGLEEMIAQGMLLVVLVGAVHWGRNGGFATAVIASLAYILMRVPLLMVDGLAPEVVEMLLIRMLSYGVIGILGGELCTRVKYIFAAMEDANSLDPVTRVFNERFIGCRLRKSVGEHERYGTDVSAILITLDPGLYLPLRKIKQRQVLRSVATHIRNDIRLVDDLGRLNDSRFLVLLPSTSLTGALVAGNRLREGVRDLLGARNESITARILGTPDNAEDLKHLVATLDLRDPEPVCREVART